MCIHHKVFISVRCLINLAFCIIYVFNRLFICLFVLTDTGTASAANCVVKRAFSCSGIGVSANGVFIALFLSPSNYTKQYLESHQIHVSLSNQCSINKLTCH